MENENIRKMRVAFRILSSWITRHVWSISLLSSSMAEMYRISLRSFRRAVAVSESKIGTGGNGWKKRNGQLWSNLWFVASYRVPETRSDA